MDLFTEEAAWSSAAERVQVFELFGEWVAWNATGSEIHQVVSDLNRRGIAIAFGGGPLAPNDECGGGIEGFAGPEEGLRIANRIKAAGGTVSFVVFDEPFAFASIYDGPNACQWPPEKVAMEVLKYVEEIRAIFPDAIFGSSEPLWPNMNVVDFERWMDAYEEVSGSPMSFIHLDVDFSIADWPQRALEVERAAKNRGVEFGIFYLGDWHDITDKDWLAHAGERVKAYEVEAGGLPEHVKFQSWHDHPDRVLPEIEAHTYTWFINAYLADKSALGVQTEGPGANLALGKEVRVSRVLPEFPREGAVDGNVLTWWGAGDFPSQWIEVDLGDPYKVAEIRLWISQDPPGNSSHRVSVKGPGTGGEYLLLHTFAGSTADMDVLIVPLPDPIEGIQFVRVETTESPSWVSWREVEVIAAD